MKYVQLPTVRIEQKEYEKFKFLVKSMNKTMSEVLREFVERYNDKKMEKKKSLEQYKFSSKKIDSTDDLDDLIY
ncbi:MAG TPA: hypothetical protein VGA67_00385 [Candidatus Dojkabacteria bacterium]